MDPLRSPFELDRHRIIESTAFRRLEGKTQVFSPLHHDHFRTRLTHTLEATQIARCLARALRVSEDVAEAITLAHDLGHPPFGHAGEAALDDMMADSDGFNHNAHSLRVVEYLEHPFPAFRGLNLTAATRAGLAAHATRYDVATGSSQPSPDRAAGSSTPKGPSFDSIEAAIASIADRIAYSCHDLEDAIGAGLVGSEALASLTLWRNALDRVATSTTGVHLNAVRRPVLDNMINTMLGDATATSLARLQTIRSPEELALETTPAVALSDGAEASLQQLEEFLVTSLYRHPAVAKSDAAGTRKIVELFEAYRRRPAELPARFLARIDDQGADRVICDYIAGMTDRFCETAHERLATS